MRKRNKSKKDAMNHKPKNKVADQFIRVTKSVKNYLIDNSIKVHTDKGQERDETITETLQRLLCIDEK